MTLLLSISLLLVYGAHAGFNIIDSDLQRRLVPAELTRGSISNKRWSENTTWKSYVNLLLWDVSLNVRIGAVSLLAVLSFPLAAGLGIYHLYLVYAGTTTNESSKWSDLRDEIWEGKVWKADRKQILGDGLLEDEVETGWPIKQSKWVIMRLKDATRRPTTRASHSAGTRVNSGALSKVATRSDVEPDDRWIRVQDLSELENIYDLGFWDNFLDIFIGRA